MEVQSITQENKRNAQKSDIETDTENIPGESERTREIELQKKRERSIVVLI